MVMVRLDATRVPTRLRSGGKIAFVSPSARLNNVFPTRIQRAKEFFESKGYEVVEIFKPISSNASHLEVVKHRCDELHRAFTDSSISVILCTIGGLSASELLPHLNYRLIMDHPKPFVGYSDITLLHSALLVQAGLRTFYGPAAIPEFGEVGGPPDLLASHFLRMLTEPSDSTLLAEPIGFPASAVFTQAFHDWADPDADSRPRPTSASPERVWLSRGRARGRILGGCLPSLVQLAGTPYMPEYGGAILLLETPEGPGGPGTPWPVELAATALADLRNAGVLTHVAGVVVGRPYAYDDDMRRRFEQVLRDQCYGLADRGVPILANVDVGHTDPKVTVPLGALCELDSDAEEGWSLLEAPVVARPL